MSKLRKDIKEEKKEIDRTYIAGTFKNKIRLVHYSNLGLVVEFHFFKPAFYVGFKKLKEIIKNFKEYEKHFKKRQDKN